MERNAQESAGRSTPLDAPTVDDKRTRQFNKILARDVSLQEIAQKLGRSVKTVYMWRLGRPRAIPPTALALLETIYPTKASRNARPGGK